MKYRCVILDHDDTVVESTKTIHYPSFMGFLELIRPGTSLSFEEYMQENFNPGFVAMCVEKFNFSDKEMEDEVIYWKEYVRNHIPVAYSGFKQILKEFREAKGIICVVSHSLEENIIRDYSANGLPMPDEVYGWGRPENERKPSPYPIFQIIEKYNLKPEEILMVDDLKPGFDMAKACNVDFAAAGWAYELPEIREFMVRYSDYYLENVDGLRNVIF